jgi:hypothetical protein
MNRENDFEQAPSPWTSAVSPMNTPPVSPDNEAARVPPSTVQSQSYTRIFSNMSPPNTARPTERPNAPTRSATYGAPDPDRNLSNTRIPQSRSEDLNHGISSSPHSPSYLTASPRPSPAFLSSANSSRPSTPGGPLNLKPRSSSGHSDDSDQHLSINSHASAQSAYSKQASSISTTATSLST